MHRESWRTTYAASCRVDVIARDAGRKTERGRGARWLDAPADGDRHLRRRARRRGIVGFAVCGDARAPSSSGLEAEIYALYVLQRRTSGAASAGGWCARARATSCATAQFGFYLWVLNGQPRARSSTRRWAAR